MPSNSSHKYSLAAKGECNGDMTHPNKDGQMEKGMSEGDDLREKDLDLQEKEVGVHYSDGQGCQRKLTNREKYLLTICFLLFCACLTFILIAFIRDNYRHCHQCQHDPAHINSIDRLPHASKYKDGLPLLTLVCNGQGSPDPAYSWILPNGDRHSGHTLQLRNLTAKHSGHYMCVVFHKYAGKDYTVNATTSVRIEYEPKRHVCLSPHCVKTAAQLIDSMDPRVDPCDDFFLYACGHWNERNVIPEDKSSFNTFEKLQDDLQITLKALLEEPPQHYDSDATLKAKTLYKSCINVTQLEIVGDAPLRRVLTGLGGLPVLDDQWSADSFHIEDVLGMIRGRYSGLVLIDCWIGADDKNSSANIIQLDQPPLGMPSREYYLHERSRPHQQAYLRYMTSIVKLLGADPAKAESEMKAVLQFETLLANVSKPQNERHDTGAMYLKLTVKELQQAIPGFNWLRYFNQFLPVNINDDEEVVVLSMEYLKDMVQTVRNADRRVVANFVLLRLIMEFVPELTRAFQHVRYDYMKVLQGILKQKPRWEKCVELLNNRLGTAVGAMFVRDNFRKESKDTALEMIEDLREAFNELLEHNTWMDDETRAVAREKANAMKERIGYPEFIVNKQELDEKIKELDFDADQYFENILRMERFDANKTLSKLGQPVNKEEWEQDPAVVNAFYNPNTNDIVFPAGILQPPFYSEYFPKSLNYGGVGVVIGHEITHGFDDKGRQYDKDGNLKQWWKNDTIEAFRQRAECMVKQYSSYKLNQIGKNIDGKNTQGENIADNGGLKQAYRAYQKWVEKHGEELVLPGLNLSHDQLFFLNYAQIWCGNMRDEEALQKIRTAVHSPGPIRALVPLSNSHDFAAAFKCPLGSRMNPVHKCSVW